MIPLWKRSKTDITDEEYTEFYKHQFNDYTEPLKVIHSKVEGMTEYTSLLFIPKKAPFDLYSEKFEKGLQLYSKGVFIMDKNKDESEDEDEDEDDGEPPKKEMVLTKNIKK